MSVRDWIEREVSRRTGQALADGHDPAADEQIRQLRERLATEPDDLTRAREAVRVHTAAVAEGDARRWQGVGSVVTALSALINAKYRLAELEGRDAGTDSEVRELAARLARDRNG